MLNDVSCMNAGRPQVVTVAVKENNSPNRPALSEDEEAVQPKDKGKD